MASVRPLLLYPLLSGPRPGTSNSQPRSTVWLHLGISKPSTSSSHLRLLYRSCGVAPDRKQVGTDTGLNHLETLEPAHPVDSYRPRWSTTTLPLHS